MHHHVVDEACVSASLNWSEIGATAICGRRHRRQSELDEGQPARDLDIAIASGVVHGDTYLLTRVIDRGGGTSPSDEQRVVGSSSRSSSVAGGPYSYPTQLSSPNLKPRPTGEDTSDTHSRGSKSSFKIGVIPPSPHLAGSPMSGFTDLPSTESGHAHDASFCTHKRTRSQDRHVPDRHAISLAAHTMNVNPEWAISEEGLVHTSPKPYRRQGDTQHWKHLQHRDLRQLSPASSTGNLRGLIDKHTSRSATNPSVSNVEKKPSKQSIRSRTQPPVPLKLDHINRCDPPADARSRQNGHHEDGNNDATLSGGARGLVESPTCSYFAESRVS
ncbi:hypothetical protein EV401DRAFT_2193103 [Pisolithus croceorrhizus]|nr:hypothetical protein EV401DRAFT_2193103 [Pisolithus croceorrhizus]